MAGPIQRRNYFALLCACALARAVANTGQPLLDAAGEGDLVKVRELLSLGSPVNARSSTGETALHVAGIKCVPGVAQALLDAGADVNAKTDPGRAMEMTPLHWYVNMNECNSERVMELVTAGANLDARNSHGETPLDMVAKLQNRQHVADLLRKAMAQKKGGGGGGADEL